MRKNVTLEEKTRAIQAAYGMPFANMHCWGDRFRFGEMGKSLA